MNTMHFDLITPEATFFAGSATMVEAPGEMGDFGILPGHMDFISTLRPGVVTIHDDKDAVTRIFIVSGIARADNASCTILAERVIDITKLTRTEGEARLAAAKRALDDALEETAEEDARREVEVAEAILTAII